MSKQFTAKNSKSKARKNQEEDENKKNTDAELNKIVELISQAIKLNVRKNYNEAIGILMEPIQHFINVSVLSRIMVRRK